MEKQGETRQMRLSLLTLFLCLFCIFPLQAQQLTSGERITYQCAGEKLSVALKAVEKLSGYYQLSFQAGTTDAYTVTADLKEATMDTALKRLLDGKPFGYRVEGRLIRLYKEEKDTEPHTARGVHGIVVDAEGLPIVGAVVRIKGKDAGAVTDMDGRYTIRAAKGQTLVFSYLGMRSEERVYQGQASMDVKLEANDELTLKGVVVNGYYSRSKESYTGSEVTIKADQLKDLGATNVLSTLSAYNPSLRITEELDYGSDPNHVPEMTLRGQSTFDLRGSAESSRNNPNGPLYIMDGIEVSAQAVYDYDINRIENITILKDASATAMYGSRGANGVIVMTTKRPQPGKIKVDFSANYTFSVPDLRDYNLMNAEEKLEFERLAGRYIFASGGLEGQLEKDRLYNSRLQEVRRGVNTYWLSQPLRTALYQKYSAILEGGDNNLRYQLHGRYDSNAGVMKGSDRNNYGIGAVLDYNVGNNFRVRNDLTISEVKGKNSPYGSFGLFAMQNPYDRIYDADGNMVKILSTNHVNPLINATLANKDLTKSTTWTDNFYLEWRFLNAFRLTARMSYSKILSQQEAFVSPKSPTFTNEKDIAKKGRATYFNTTETTMDGNVLLSYYNTFRDIHTLSMTLGTNFTDNTVKGQGFVATGFLNDNLANIHYAQQYAANSKPNDVSDISRLFGVLLNMNYGLRERYYIDFSFRTDGSSKFGSNKRFAPFWSLGLAWNVHKEKFMNKDFGTLRLRASVGSTGNINFASSQAITRYTYMAQNIYLDSWGATLQDYGNNNLKWQQTMAYNLGVDLTLFKGRLAFYGDVYRKLTNNLLLPMNVAPSTGFSSYTENVGEVENTGFELRLSANWLKTRDWSWTTTLSTFHNKNKIRKISNELEEMNRRNNTKQNSNITGKVVNQYENGNSTTAIYVVRSAGIDPATGNEVYYKRDGSMSFIYDYKDKVVVGDTEPKFNGNIINNLRWKDFNLYAVATYRYGGKSYNSTLATKVEGANPAINADRRVLYDRWKEPGDHAKYRRIDDMSPVYQTSRFVQDNNTLVLSNLSLTYTLPQKWISNLGIEYVKIIAATTDLFRLSTIKQERGTSYPYARSFSMGINVRF